MTWWDRLRGREGGEGGERPDRRAPDPYESAARRMDSRRAYESMGEPGVPVGVEVNRARRRQMLWLVLIVAVAVLFVTAKGRTASQPLASPDCGPVAVTLAATSVASGEPLRYTITGPASTSVIVTVDIARLVPTGGGAGQFQYVPRPGVPLSQTVRDVPRALTGCAFTSFVVATFPAGAHTFDVFDASTGGDPLVSKPFTVTG